ncbi:MAG: glutaredoxin [Burkholderiaceae bacterium]|jgi:monothiol glutaredoxin|nr:glutaredoxin [Burkholderiaceae bacterium]
MTRSVLPEQKIHSDIQATVAQFNQDIFQEVQLAIAQHAIVVVGMKQNPVVKNVRNLFKESGISYHYLEYGSYFSQWKRRLALKMWSGWPTFPMVFRDGVLLGGHKEVKALIARQAI